MEIVKFIGLLAFTWLMVEGAEPVQFLKKYFKVHPEIKVRDITRQLIGKLLACGLCLGFWIGFFYYWYKIDFESGVLLGSLVSIGSDLFQRIINFIHFKVFNNI